jgi:hypothetical protein
MIAIIFSLFHNGSMFPKITVAQILCFAFAFFSITSVPSGAFGQGSPSAQTRMSNDETELRHWLENMVWHHGFQREEITQVTGLAPSQLDEALKRFNISPGSKPLRR